MRSRKNYADWSYQARTNRVKIVGCPNAENRWPDWTVFLFSAFLCWFVWRYVVSIHAPTRGATFPCLCIRMVLTSFNPRSHEGSDYTAPPYRKQSSCFNPRSHEGSDRTCLALSNAHPCFNPRSHEGSNLRGCWRKLRGFRFNPRSHEGSDVIMSPCQYTLSVVSIHAPTRGATCPHGGGSPSHPCFNPRSHEGSDPYVGVVRL